MLESISIEDIQHVTNSAAKSVIDLHGSMDKNSIDGAAVNAMRQALNQKLARPMFPAQPASRHGLSGNAFGNKSKKNCAERSNKN